MNRVHVYNDKVISPGVMRERTFLPGGVSKLETEAEFLERYFRVTVPLPDLESYQYGRQCKLATETYLDAMKGEIGVTTHNTILAQKA